MIANAVMPYRDAEHRPFYWHGRNDGYAALLLHGFPGTPAEMRALGRALCAQGWTVHAPLLPGFGPAIHTLAGRSYREWVSAGVNAAVELGAAYDKVLLVGNSMGGALTMLIAQSTGAAGVVLTAPFTRFARQWQHLMWPLFSRMLKQFRPFEHADMASPEIARLVRRMFNHADPKDPTVEAWIRDIAVSTRAIDQVRRVGKLAFREAPNLTMPTLIMQGLSDRVVAAQTTRRLIRRMRNCPLYYEFDAGHDLVETDGPAWSEVESQVKNFATGLMT